MVFASSSLFELKPESIQPNTFLARADDPIPKFSYARFPSIEVASAYDKTAWHNFRGSQETGLIKSRVWVRQTGEEQGIGTYDFEDWELKIEFKFGDFLQWSQESSLPVSRTIVTFCGGVPTETVTVRVTLWLKGSLLVVAAVVDFERSEEW